MRAHAESVNLQFENPLDEVLHAVLCETLMTCLRVLYPRSIKCIGIKLHNPPSPTPLPKKMYKK